jgi:hypothetical protein
MREAAVQPAGQPPVGVAEQVHYSTTQLGARDRAQLMVLAYQAGRPGARVPDT